MDKESVTEYEWVVNRKETLPFLITRINTENTIKENKPVTEEQILSDFNLYGT